MTGLVDLYRSMILIGQKIGAKKRDVSCFVTVKCHLYIEKDLPITLYEVAPLHMSRPCSAPVGSVNETVGHNETGTMCT